MHFTKFHGQGNDFLLLEAADFSGAAASPEAQVALVQAMCNRHYGAGADGLITLERDLTSAADFRMRLWNADGSTAEMSGNGVRCAAAYACFTNQWTAPVMRIATDAGVKTIQQQSRHGKEFWFEVDIGVPRLQAQEIPVLLDLPAPLVEIPIQAGNREIRATLTSMGNPHCSVFVENLDLAEVLELGPQLERHPLFPARTNVEFIQVCSPDRLRVLFWERGAGHTLSSGTGSCASSVAAMLCGKVNRSVTVETEAGELQIRWPENGSVVLTGPACFVYHGEFEP